MKLVNIIFSLALIGLTSCNKDRAGLGDVETSTNLRNAFGATSQPTISSRNLVESRESVYNDIYVYRSGTNLVMTFGFNKKIYTESIYNPLDETELPVPYTRFMSASLLYPKKISSILEIGSGGGRVAWYLHRVLPDAKVTTVELDPTVSQLAEKYFGVKEERNLHFVTRDGRIFLADSPDKFDIVLIDAYRGPFVPFHMLTREFYQIVKDHLSDGGVIAQNIEPSTMLFDSDVNTLHEVFSQIEFYDASASESGGNVVLIAYNGDGMTASQLNQRAERLQSTLKLRYDLTEMLGHRFGLKPVWVGQKLTFDVVDQSGKSTAGIDENAKALTDDFAPVDSLKAIENHNHKWATQ